MQKERPTEITKQQAKELYTKLAKEITKRGWSSSDIEEIEQDMEQLLEWNYNDNGFELAKELESYNYDADYDIDSEFIVWLDDLFSGYRDLITQNEKLWVKAHDIKPVYKIGDPLIITKLIEYHLQVETVIYITNIHEDIGYYVVDQDKNRKGGYLIKYEKIESHCSKVRNIKY